MTAVSAAADFERAFRGRLDGIALGGRTLRLWVRDDDAVAPTDALETFLESVANSVPVALAVIPSKVSERLPELVTPFNRLRVVQHGWAHVSHALPGAKNAEFGDTRPVPEALDDLQQGHRCLTDRFADRFAPILVPPWNRISPAIAGRRMEVGLTGLSTFGPAVVNDPHQVNTHLDIIAWRTTRGFIGWQRAWQMLSELIDHRLNTSVGEPIGVLTHHLVHDADCRAFLKTFVAVTARHPAIVWPEIDDLFGLEQRYL